MNQGSIKWIPRWENHWSSFCNHCRRGLSTQTIKLWWPFDETACHLKCQRSQAVLSVINDWRFVFPRDDRRCDVSPWFNPREQGKNQGGLLCGHQPITTRPKWYELNNGSLVGLISTVQ